MEKTKKQYLAQIQNGWCEEGDWWNAKMMFSTGRYCKTKEEAQQWIDKAIEKSTQRSIIGTPPFSLESDPCEKDRITATRIRVREVTDWEEV